VIASKKSRIPPFFLRINSSEEDPPKGKKRALEEPDEAPQLVDTAGLSKSQKKKLKKQKLNSGETADANGAERKVQFAAKLEQGPTGGQTEAKAPAKPALAATAKTETKPEKKTITLTDGVTIEEHKLGSGPKAKMGAKLGLRYIGKLAKNGKEFDKNKKGKPFRFTLGKGEVIKGIVLVWGMGC
jgi:FK506-binding nuclear protein